MRSDSSGIPVYHYRCGFCSYTYVSTSGIVLEQHVRMLHQVEVTNARAKAVAAAAVAEKAEKNGKERLKSALLLIGANFQCSVCCRCFQTIGASKSNVWSLIRVDNSCSRSSKQRQQLSGLHTNVRYKIKMFIIYAFVKAHCRHISFIYLIWACLESEILIRNVVFSVGNSSTGYPYTGSFSAGLLSDSIMRSMAEQTATSQSNATDRGLSGVEALAYQRQQTINSVIQQAAAAAGKLVLKTFVCFFR